MTDSLQDRLLFFFERGEFGLAKCTEALGVGFNTLHTWRKRHYLNFQSTSAGHALYVNGETLLYIRSIVIMTKLGVTPKNIHQKGLSDCIHVFCEELIRCILDNKKLPEHSYAVAMCTSFGIDPECSNVEFNFIPFETPCPDPINHIQSANDKPLPAYISLDLMQITVELEQMIRFYS